MRPVRTSRGPPRNCTKIFSRQLAAQPRSRILVGDLRLQLGVEGADLVGQQHEMQQHIGVHDEKQARPQDEETDER